MVSTHGGAIEWSGSNKAATFRFSTIHVVKHETLYISVNPERELHFTAQLKHVVIVISDERLCEYFLQLLNGDINSAESLWRCVNVANISNLLPPASGQI
jgi:hypothetical protein